ncbi:flagellar hook-basal body complex protein FliE [Clostridium tetani]|uniref:Flagellar hook-basal body complex protein FliE n=1 Tax=Clostridium tetani TaxID=1513 RepID=A0ABY0ENV2_CLOTA|nr:flagellar hook-basal body complex protein FliE [Clostridium tetani]CDI49808.1 flagellar hook-basal body protein FliE [Clostridium tetani 12124569]KHO38905.1 flagellar hook-basal body protein FliE [Clostridium tetani]RXI37475.1 flagellar hook-basal body complex protein FliE [Clostridium tetani]RXI52069.1 flagellar hook-basal body complex protein FliE [Clostridium tetani]RXI67957.1 flagellar hook-basal body complex protein FliE [Clostridium tetani]
MKINEFIPNNMIFKNDINNKIEKKKEENNGFSHMLKNKLDQVNEKQIKAEETTENFLQGEETDIHKVMLDSEEAKLSVELAVQVRNKLIEAYQELNRMQL